MKKNKIFFITSMPVILAFCSLFAICDSVYAAARTPSRGTPASRKPALTNTLPAQKSTNTTTETVAETIVEAVSEQPKKTNSEPVFEEEKSVVVNKSSQFDDIVSNVVESAAPDNSFAEQIRKQRAALAAADASSSFANAQKKSAQTGSNACDSALRKCMVSKCGDDFSNCALDGDTIFGDKLNACRRDTNCTAEEFTAFTREIKDDRDMNARLGSYNRVINCGNQYNACIMNECGTTYSKCLGKKFADAATEKCNMIAKECMEADSSLASRFGTAIGKLRENAEIEVKKDEEQLYKLRDLMRSTCQGLGATFDERSFDCVYTVNFFTGAITDGPTASRKRYAGDTFVCMQEWFGVNATTFKENAYRETASQTAASSAMLGSGLGVAAGAISSGAIDRAVDTQKAKKDLKEECKAQSGNLKNGECVFDEKKAERQEERAERKAERQEKREDKKEERQEKRTENKENKKSKQTDSNDEDSDVKEEKNGKGKQLVNNIKSKIDESKANIAERKAERQEKREDKKEERQEKWDTVKEKAGEKLGNLFNKKNKNAEPDAQDGLDVEAPDEAILRAPTKSGSALTINQSTAGNIM